VSATDLEDRSTSAPSAAEPRGLCWWLRVAEVRLRFVGLLLLALLVVSQWDRLRGTWDRLWYSAVGSPPTAVSADTEYFCPMDPGVLSAWPAICPICNMDLVPRRKHDAQLLPEGVVARMQLSPYRVQLAGIKTSEVAALPLSHEIRVAGRLTHGDESASEPSGASRQELAFVAAISPADAPLVAETREASVTTSDGSASAPGVATLVQGQEAPRVRIVLKDSEGFAIGMNVRAVVRVPAVDRSAPAVPETAVVDHGDQRIVFVESMPGQFDAVPVKLGRRSGDHYPVLAGLKPGQRVAMAGAFLIDAETRLNPSLAVAYFGANQASAPSRAPQVRIAKDDKGGIKLSPEDVALAKRQKICPVTELPLDSMGGPVPVIVEGRKVFICCAGCENKLRSEPEKYLAKLPGDD
jgi:Cu(I)/Ag(I) efflux system membrane fusion protein